MILLWTNINVNDKTKKRSYFKKKIFCTRMINCQFSRSVHYADAFYIGKNLSIIILIDLESTSSILKEQLRILYFREKEIKIFSLT